MKKLFAANLAGVAATLPMTTFIKIAHRWFPRAQREPLPPPHITLEASERAGLGKPPRERQRFGMAQAAQFGYGAQTGGADGLIAPRIPLSPLAKGAAYGLVVWAASYGLWLPALGLYRPSEEEPRERSALLIGAHLLSRASLGLLFERLALARKR